MVADVSIEEKRIMAKRKLAQQKLQSMQQSQTVYRPDTGMTISAPVGMTARDIMYHDDVSNRGKSDESFWGKMNIGTPVDLAKGYMQGIVQGGANLQTVTLENDEERLQKIRQWQSGSGDFTFVDWLFEPGQPVWQKQLPRSDRWNNEAQRLEAKISETRGALKKMPQVLDAMGLNTGGSFLGDLGQGVSSIAQTMGIAIATKSPALATAVFGAQQKSSDYKEAREAGLSIEDASSVSTETAASTAAIELVGTRALFKVFGESRVLQRAFKGFLVQGSEEGSQELAQILIKNGHNVTDTRFNDAVGQIAYSALIGGLVGAPVSAVLGPDINAISKEMGLPPEDIESIVRLSEAAANNSTVIIDIAQQQLNNSIDEELAVDKNNTKEQAEVEAILDDFIERRPIRDATERDTSRTTERGVIKEAPILKSEILNKEWLVEKQREATENASKFESGLEKNLFTGAVTGSFDSTVLLKPSDIINIPTVSEDGASSEASIPTIGVNQNGDAFILEGGDKISSAVNAGMDGVPVEIKYWNGGELVEGGDFSPNTVSKLAQSGSQKELSQLYQNTVPMSSSQKNTPELGEALGFSQRVQNAYRSQVDRMQRLNINKNQMDVIFDMLDGGQDYQGPNHRLFKRTLDRGWGEFSNLKLSVTSPVTDAANRLKLSQADLEKIGAYAIIQQEGGRKKLMDTGYSGAELDAVQLSENQMEFYNIMRGQINRLEPMVTRVYKNLNNEEMELVDNYFPFLTDLDKQDMLPEVQEMFKIPDVNEQKKVADGFTIERTLGKQAVKINAMEVFLQHAEAASYYVTMSEDISRLGEVATSQEYREAAGDYGQDLVVEWLNLMARRGGAKDRIRTLDTLRKNVGFAILGYKVSTVLIQPTALTYGSAMIGGDYIASGVTQLGFSKEWRQFLVDNVPEIRDRFGGDPSFLDFGGGSGLVDDVQQAGFWAMRHTDKLTASAVAIGAYKKYINDNGLEMDFDNPNQDAVDYAELMVRRTQSSGNFKDAAPLIVQGRFTGNSSVDKTIFQFQSFMLNAWSLLQHDVPSKLKRGKTLEATNAVAWIAIALMDETGIRRMTKELMAYMLGGEYEEDPYTDDLIKTAINSVPIVSQGASVLNYGSLPVPSVSLANQAVTSLTYGGRSKSADKKQKHYTNAALMASGLIGVPGVLQAKQIKTQIEKGFDEKNGRRKQNTKKKRKLRQNTRD